MLIVVEGEWELLAVEKEEKKEREKQITANKQKGAAFTSPSKGSCMTFFSGKDKVSL